MTMASPADTNLSKIEIVEFHLLSAIQMVALEQSEVSTHVIVMACEEMIISLADASNIFLDHDYRIYIKDEHHKDYRRLIRKPYNFFKHADTDSGALYEGPSLSDLGRVNEVTTLVNASGYRKLGGKRLNNAINIFAATMLVKTPKLFKQEWVDSHPEFKALLEEIRPQPEYAYIALREHLYRQGHLPQIPYNSRTLHRTDIVL
jgi:hypothetical protein